MAVCITDKQQGATGNTVSYNTKLYATDDSVSQTVNRKESIFDIIHPK